MSLSELQKGNRIGAAKYAAESIGMFLHSEIVDKHLGYIRYVRFSEKYLLLEVS